jgi:hypothetical protein
LAIKSLFFSNIVACVLALPMIVYTFKQLSSSFYWQSIERINLVYTRLPTLDAYYYGRWALFGIVLVTMFFLSNGR